MAVALLKKGRRVPERIGLRLVVVDPQRRVLALEDVGELLHGCEALFLVEVARGHAPVLPVLPEMNRVSRQQYRPGFRQPDQQRLMAVRVPRVE